MKLRQAELAEAAGASREAVAMALKAFREAGAVRTNRCSFDLDLDALRAFADGLPDTGPSPSSRFFRDTPSA